MFVCQFRHFPGSLLQPLGSLQIIHVLPPIMGQHLRETARGNIQSRLFEPRRNLC